MASAKYKRGQMGVSRHAFGMAPTPKMVRKRELLSGLRNQAETWKIW